MAGGDCFEVAANIVVGWKRPMFNQFRLKLKSPVLVHAEVSGQGPLEGVRYGHAWVLDQGTVYDYSNGRKTKMPAVVYYAVGRVVKEEPKYFEYTPEDTIHMMVLYEHYGPWDLETESGL